MIAKIRKAGISRVDRTRLVGDIIYDDEGAVLSDNRVPELHHYLRVLVFFPDLADNDEHLVEVDLGVVNTKAKLRAAVKAEGVRLMARKQEADNLDADAETYGNMLCGSKPELEVDL